MKLFSKKIQPISTTPQSKKTIDALWRLEKIILDTLDFKQVVQKIVDSVLLELGYLNLGYRIVVLALVDEEDQILKRISISQTSEAIKALEVTPVPFHEMNISLSESNNLCIRAINENKAFVTHDWVEIFTPLYTPIEARQVQTVVGIKTSMIYPIISKGKPIGILIFSMIKSDQEVSESERDLIRGFTDVVGLGVQNAQLYSSLEAKTVQLDIANDKLKALDKLKDDFVSMASHELRTPMTAIKSYLWMALNKRKQELGGDLQRYLDKAYLATDRLINLVNDMLNVSRIESGRIALKLSEVNLKDLAREVLEEVKPKADEKKLHLNLIDSDTPNVLCDKDKIHEILLNLVGNSLKFTNDNGNVSVSFVVQNDYLVTTVTDDGRGIAPEDASKLFMKFGQLGNSYVRMSPSGGTGLGLYISKLLINVHKGTIEAKSAGLDKGSQFSFSLPIVGTSVANQLMQEAPKETDETKPLEKTNVLVS